MANMSAIMVKQDEIAAVALYQRVIYITVCGLLRKLSLYIIFNWYALKDK